MSQLGKSPDFAGGIDCPIIKRRYNGHDLLVLECKIPIDKIQGWVENPRIDLARKKLQGQTGRLELTQDEVFDIMKTDKEVKLKELRDDIFKNGLRRPLTLSYQGVLLDGNRRFFALKYVLENLSLTDPRRHDFENVSVYILTSDATPEDENHVLVEENFSASLKIEWPAYIKAKKINDEFQSINNIETIATKFGWKKTEVKTAIEVYAIIEDFIAFATTSPDDDETGLGMSEPDAEIICSEHYQFFNEAYKSFKDPLKTDYDFKIQFFKWIAEKKFSRFDEVRIAYKAWKNENVFKVLSQPDPGAAKRAKTLLEYNDRICKDSCEIAERVKNFLSFLNSLSIEDLQKIPSETRTDLIQVLQVVESTFINENSKRK